MNMEKKVPQWSMQELTNKIVPLIKEIPMKEREIDHAINTISKD